jgi:DNA ligase-1
VELGNITPSVGSSDVLQEVIDEAIVLKSPQLAASEIPDLEKQVDYPKWMQRKYDGIACLAVNGVAMSRTMKLIPNLYIQKYFADNKLHGWQGELMIKGDFNDVQSGVMAVEGEPDFYYVVYDRWDSDEPYWRRFEDLGVFKAIPHERIQVVETYQVEDAEEANQYLDSFINEGFEGGMLRDFNSLYKQGRHTLKSQALLKLKKWFDDEAEIIGFEEKMHNQNEKTKDERGYSKRSSHKKNMVPADTLGALIVKWNGAEFNIGSGFDEDQRKQLWDSRESLLGKLVTFKYFSVFPKTGKPRNPIFKAIREEFNV